MASKQDLKTRKAISLFGSMKLWLAYKNTHNNNRDIHKLDNQHIQISITNIGLMMKKLIS